MHQFKPSFTEADLQIPGERQQSGRALRARNFAPPPPEGFPGGGGNIDLGGGGKILKLTFNSPIFI